MDLPRVGLRIQMSREHGFTLSCSLRMACCRCSSASCTSLFVAVSLRRVEEPERRVSNANQRDDQEEQQKGRWGDGIRDIAHKCAMEQTVQRIGLSLGNT